MVARGSIQILLAILNFLAIGIVLDPPVVEPMAFQEVSVVRKLKLIEV